MDKKNLKKNIFGQYWLMMSGLVIVLALSLVGNAILINRVLDDNGLKADRSLTEVIIKPAKAAEIYPEFVCGCCGKPLDPAEICCGDMGQKIDYIDSLVASGLGREEIIMAAAKKFGLNAVAKNKTKELIRAQLAASAPLDSAKIIFDKAEQDWGVVSQAQGVVSRVFNFTNPGKSDLVINNLTTSCGCTSAAIVYRGVEGPTFTMPGHGKDNPVGWRVAIAPGESAQVKVYYDPNAHGVQTTDKEFITRTISVFSNDPVEFEKQLKIELEQIP